MFSTEPSPADSAEVRDLAATLMDSLKSGSSFESLATTYSDDQGSAEKGGDLGFFGKGAMVKPFEEAAFAAKKGEIVGPVKSNFGLHIIQVEDKKFEDGEQKVKARHILLKFKASRSTQEAARDNANYFAEVASEEGFTTTANIDKIEIDTTDYFSDTGFIPSLGMQKRIAMSAFNKKIDENSKVYFIDGKGYLVYKLVGIQAEKVKSLEEVRQTIVTKLKRELQYEKAKLAAQQAREKIQLPEDLERIATEDSLEVKTTNSFTRDGNITGVGRDPVFAGAAMALDENEVSQPVKGTRGYYLIRSKEKTPFDEEGFKAQREQLKAQILETKRRSVYSNWVTNMKENANIEDYRYVFF